MKLWKDLRTNFMYWRFRNITRNRLRLKAWWARTRPSWRRARPATGFRERGLASRPLQYRGFSRRRTWITLVVMVLVLSLLSTAASRWAINGALLGSIRLLVIAGALYWALRGV